MTIDMLPDDVLVEIFFYVNIRDRYPGTTMRNTMACTRACVSKMEIPRVCITASPQPTTRVWWTSTYVGGAGRLASSACNTNISRRISPSKSDQRWDNMVAALESEHYNRICEIYIDDMTNSRWERFAAAMQKPFPELTHLEVWGRWFGASPS
jgi:hypothetical protein